MTEMRWPATDSNVTGKNTRGVAYARRAACDRETSPRASFHWRNQAGMKPSSSNTRIPETARTKTAVKLSRAAMESTR